ncbi:tetratricopeptide repeat protein [Ruegeria marisrubri]|uniref:tetratricopeptide repeat protein n=1 Tax=Ruegeria marisrubri TaxID=1685379 RepID=UPI001CD4D99B|nr:tetratricopeptide repeat protein [Ruegeria marisrubri]MCA0908427.1 tetratricopeptide repeat protein [Ruegeria marisrubri]
MVAVLPFDTLGEGPSYFADGITQQLTSELVRFRDIWVLPLGSVRRFSQGGTDSHALRAEFDADFALEGSVMDMGDTVVLSARLIDLKSQRYIWVHEYKAGSSPSDIYAAQDRIIQDVIGKLAGKYGVLTQDAMKKAARTPPGNRDAFDCVLSYYNYQVTIDLDRHHAIKACILRALEQNPEYAEAWAVLSNLYLQQIRFGLGGDRQGLFAAADAAARRAVEIDPNLAAGHLMLANMRFVLGDIQGFRQAGQVAIDLSPNDTAVLAHYGMRLAFSGEWEEGLTFVERAIALNPVHPHWYRFPRVFYEFDQGNHQQALTILDQIDMPNFVWTHLWGAALNGELGRQEAAQASLNELRALQPDFASKAQDILSIWQLDDSFQRKLLNSLRKAGLQTEA